MSSCGAGGRCVWVEMLNQLAARLVRYDGEATMVEFEAIFAGSCDNAKAEDWSALGMARVLIVARWPKGAKEAFSEKETSGASSLLARQWVPRPRQFSLNIHHIGSGSSLRSFNTASYLGDNATHVVSPASSRSYALNN